MKSNNSFKNKPILNKKSKEKINKYHKLKNN